MATTDYETAAKRLEKKVHGAGVRHVLMPPSTPDAKETAHAYKQRERDHWRDEFVRVLAAWYSIDGGGLALD